METLNTIINNWDSILTGLAGLHAAALVLVQFTPSETDDKRVAQVWTVINVLAGLVTTAARNNTVELNRDVPTMRTR